MTAVAGLRIGWGAVLLSAPAAVLKAVGAPLPSRQRRRVLRLLGARQVLQGLLTWRARRRGVLAASAATDGVHGLSCLAAAALDHSWRPAAWYDATIAAGFGCAGLYAVRRLSS